MPRPLAAGRPSSKVIASGKVLPDGDLGGGFALCLYTDRRLLDLVMGWVYSADTRSRGLIVHILAIESLCSNR